MAKVEAAGPCARITGRILEQLERGVRPWTQPWSAEHLIGSVTRPLRATGSPTRASTSLLLWIEAVATGHPSSTWMTYRQAQAWGGAGAQRRAWLSRGLLRVDHEARRGRGPAGAGGGGEVRFLKTYTVFNIAQVDGPPERFAPEAPPLPCPFGARADRACRRLPQRDRRLGSAWWSPSLLFGRGRPYAASAAGSLPRRRGLLHDLGA